MKTIHKRLSALFVTLVLSLSIASPVLASGGISLDNLGAASAGDTIEALYSLDDMPLMVEDLHVNEASYTCKQDAEAWADAYAILPDGLEMEDELTQGDLAAILYQYAQHHDIDVSADSAAARGGWEPADAENTPAASWAVSEGILPANGESGFDAAQNVTMKELSSAIENYQQADLQPVGVRSNGLALLYPSEDMRTISPLCDFYVIGDIDESVSVPDNAQLMVRLTNASGTLVRAIYTNTKDNQDGMYVDYPELSVTGNREAFKASMMPDLVYDPNRPESFRDTWIKAYYNDRHYTSVVYGGSYRQDINPVDQFGRTLAPLPEGDYDLTVTLSDGQKTLATLSTQITIGVIAKKAITRFSPDSYLEEVKKYCAQNGIVVFSDPYAGNWNTQSFMPSWGMDYTGEIAKRWLLVDREGYIGGLTYFFDYNISQTSISYRVELGQLGYDRVLNDQNHIKYCYYDIGEPTIKQQGKIYKGTFVLGSPGIMGAAVFTRADYSPIKTQDNFISPAILNEATSVFNLNQIVPVNVGDTLSLNGICQVIQSENVTYLPETESFKMDNRVAGIRYTIYNAAGQYVKTVDKKISGLQREFENGYISTSIVVFRHNFLIDESMRGNTFRIIADPYDEFGNDIGSLFACDFKVSRG